MTPVDYILLINLNTKDPSFLGPFLGRRLRVVLNIKFASEKQRETIQDNDFAEIIHLLNDCLPRLFSVGDIPNMYGKQNEKKFITHLDLSKTETVKQPETNYENAIITPLKMNELKNQI